MSDILKKNDLSEAELINSYRILLTEKIARNIAHEIRNPLTNVMLGLDQLKNEFTSEKNEPFALYFNIIKRNCDRINELISSLVDAAKPLSLTISDHSVNKLLDEVLAGVDEKIKSGKIKIQKKYTLKTSPIALDGEKIKSAFLNVILNAIQSMEGKTGLLEIQTEFKDKKCTIKFTDNGIGISKENLPLIFDPFFRIRSSGKGLGLTTAQNIIHNHKGNIRAESQPGIGSTFTINLSV
ncbi:MAG: hypothetical protein H0V01_00395 [Bacteroidetes bacterium]|nr:hypothetical protein [Bacteroidota bacterium]HET6245665.1 ATP-binding protein [Bacteroidia bacterium]